MRKSWIRGLLWSVGGIVLLLAIAWLLLVPSLKEPPYILAGAWGEAGDGAGQFRDPTGIAVTEDAVFVSDARNGRIQVFTRDGRFRGALGRPGTALGELGRPMNLDIHGRKLFVPEYFNDRIQIFTTDGIPVTAFGRPGDGRGNFRAPGGVAASAEGALYVAEFMGHRVQKLGADGGFLHQWGAGEASRMRGAFTYPTDVALAEDGMLYIADGYAHRIQAIAPDGEIAAVWGGAFGLGIPGPFKGWFNAVTSIAIGPDGNLFAVDSYNGRVQKFAPDGTFLTSFGAGELAHPVAVAVAHDGTVYVTDLPNQRVTVWRPPG